MIKLIRMILHVKGILAMAGFQVHLYHTLHTTHQKLAISGNETSDAATHIEASLKWLDNLLPLHIVEEETVVGAQPHAIIDRVVSHGTGKQEQTLKSSIHHKRRNLARLLEVHHGKARTPGSYPEVATVVGGKSRHAVMRQTGIGNGIMNKVLATRSQRVESALHGSYPQRTIGCRIHGIDGIGRKTSRVRGIMAIEFELQLAGSQLGNATRFGGNPNLSVLGKQTVHEVTAQRIDGTIAVPMFYLARFFIEDIHTAECSHQEFIIRRDGKARHHLVLKRVVGSRAMILLLGAIKQAAIGGKPDFSVIRDDIASIAIFQQSKQGSDIPGNQPVILHREFAHHSIVA